jgi:hypothetical protein
MAQTLYKVGQIATDTPGNIKYGSWSNTAANHYDSLKTTVAGTVYQVGVGKTFYWSYLQVGRTTTAGDRGSLAQADAQALDTTTASGVGLVSGNIFITQSVTAPSIYKDFILPFAASKYPLFFSNDAAQSGWGSGIEV